MLVRIATIGTLLILGSLSYIATPAKATQLLPRDHRIRDLPLNNQEIWYEKNISHAQNTIRFWTHYHVGSNRSLQKLKRREYVYHSVLLRNARRNLANVQSRVNELNPWRYVTPCIAGLIRRESAPITGPLRLNVHADNPNSEAYGIPQANPGSKMAMFGNDWAWNAVTQLKWMWWYVKTRYGSDCNALAFREANGYY